MVLKTAAEVGCLVLGDDVLAAKALQKSAYLIIGFLSLFLVCHFAYSAHCVSCSLCPITVVKSTLLSLANSFQ